MAASLACGLMVSCSSSDKDKALALYGEAEAQMNAGEYANAQRLLDSINTTYPAEIEVRRKAMHLLPKVIEKNCLGELSHTDSLLAVHQLQSDSLGGFITRVENPIEPYFVASGFEGKNILATPGLYARMTPDGQFYIVSTVNKPLNATSVSISLPDGVVAHSAVVPFDGERNDKQGGAEVITFMQSECDTIGALAAKCSDKRFTLTYHGGKQWSTVLPDDQLRALATMYEAASLIREMKVLQIRKTRLEKQIELSRSQQARTFNDND